MSFVDNWFPMLSRRKRTQRGFQGRSIFYGPVRTNLLEAGRAVPWRQIMTKNSPFRYFKTSPDIIRIAVMLYVRFPLSLRNVEDPLQERGIEISHETVRF